MKIGHWSAEVKQGNADMMVYMPQYEFHCGRRFFFYKVAVVVGCNKATLRFKTLSEALTFIRKEIKRWCNGTSIFEYLD